MGQAMTRFRFLCALILCASAIPINAQERSAVELPRWAESCLFHGQQDVVVTFLGKPPEAGYELLALTDTRVVLRKKRAGVTTSCTWPRNRLP
ncbi:MAG: hypothetical protein QM811_17320 [Pirellulales bacterium]